MINKNFHEKNFNTFKSSQFSSIKSDNYFEIYESSLKRIVNKNITLAENGIWNGDYFIKKWKIYVLIDDSGHTNLQQNTTLMESIENIKNNEVIIIEDTHTSFMNYKGFKNPSKNSLIGFSTNLIENIHRRNPMTKKKMNIFSKKIYSIEYFDSIVLININKNNFL